MGVRMCGLALALALFATPLVAQETVNSASVSGRVTDPQGAAVPGASVTARQTETNVTRETVTDQEGRFRLPYLKVGPYAITVKLQGFADVTRTLTLTVGSAFELPVSLKVGTVETSVTVSAEAVVLEAARSQIAGTVSQTEVRNLPMNGRNFLDLALLVPGVSPTNVASTTSLRLSRAFAVRDRLRLEGLVEAFNLTNRVNVVTVQGNFGAGAYPANPVSNFRQVLAVGEPRSAQLGLRLRF